MAEPELFVDEPDGLIDRYALVARHADIGKRQKLENAILDPPDGAQLIARPGTLDVGDDLVIARTFKRPSVRTEIRSEEHTSELQSLMRISYAVFCLQKKKHIYNNHLHQQLTTTNN